MMNWPGNRSGRADAGEPAPDPRLAALLRDSVGEPPLDDVNWHALSNRIGEAVRAYDAAPWWSYAEKWQRRAVPLAVAAGLVGALSIWNAARSGPLEVASAATDVVSAVVGGSSSTDAASAFARSVIGSADLATVVPE
jgi:hypothetical protein